MVAYARARALAPHSNKPVLPARRLDRRLDRRRRGHAKVWPIEELKAVRPRVTFRRGQHDPKRSMGVSDVRESPAPELCTGRGPQRVSAPMRVPRRAGWPRDSQGRPRRAGQLRGGDEPSSIRPLLHVRRGSRDRPREAWLARVPRLPRGPRGSWITSVAGFGRPAGVATDAGAGLSEGLAGSASGGGRPTRVLMKRMHVKQPISSAFKNVAFASRALCAFGQLAIRPAGVPPSSG
jgi:hypothetical protein